MKASVSGKALVCHLSVGTDNFAATSSSGRVCLGPGHGLRLGKQTPARKGKQFHTNRSAQPRLRQNWSNLPSHCADLPQLLGLS